MKRKLTLTFALLLLSTSAAWAAETLFWDFSADAQLQTQDDSSRRPSIRDADVTPPRLIYSPGPKYPADARLAGHQGTSILSLTVGTDGLLRGIKIVRRLDDELDQSAVAAVSTWQYEPARKRDVPVEVDIHARVRFRIYEGSDGKIAELWDRSDASDPKADWELSRDYFEGTGVP
jgi:TonB family protein